MRRRLRFTEDVRVVSCCCFSKWKAHHRHAEIATPKKMARQNRATLLSCCCRDVTSGCDRLGDGKSLLLARFCKAVDP
jgi:hypothetical protein